MQNNPYTLAYVGFFLEKYFCNVKGTDIDCSMCSTILPSGDSSGPTLEVPSEALLHRSKLQSIVVRTTSFLRQNQINLIILTKKLVCSKYFS